MFKIDSTVPAFKPWNDTMVHHLATTIPCVFSMGASKVVYTIPVLM
jgi:hypothetical protein